jgi:hypothetical protein
VNADPVKPGRHEVGQRQTTINTDVKRGLLGKVLEMATLYDGTECIAPLRPVRQSPRIANTPLLAMGKEVTRRIVSSPNAFSELKKSARELFKLNKRWHMNDPFLGKSRDH